MRLTLRFFTGALVSCVLGTFAHAETYYVAIGGSNDAPGTQAEPFATVAYALGQANGGDTVRLERGSIFREQSLSIPGNVTVEPYGDEELSAPTLTGSVEVTDWERAPENPSIWTASLSGTPQQVYVNGALMTLAREPDSGWYRTEQTTNNSIFDTALRDHPDAVPGYWTGAQIRWRRWSWWYETRPITNDDGNGNLSLGARPDAPGAISDSSGYYIDNSINALDYPGEWYFAGETLYLIPPDDVDPRFALIEAATREDGITVNVGSTLRGVTVRQYTRRCVTVNGRGTVDGCEIYHSGEDGIVGNWGSAGAQIVGNHIHDILNVGIWWNENPNGPGGTLLEGNLLERIGTFPGLGGSGSWHAAGVILVNANESGNGVIFRYNRIYDTGYAGIIMGADGQNVIRNVLFRAMSTLNDGGAIYCNAHRNNIRENLIYDTIGDTSSAQPFTPLGAGIWPEFLENFEESEIVGNTVYGSNGYGLFLPNNFDCLVTDNVFLSNRIAGFWVGGHEEGRSDNDPNQNHTMARNILGIGAIPWNSDRPETLAEWALREDYCLVFNQPEGIGPRDFGTMTDTVFITQDSDDFVAEGGRTELTLAAWQGDEASWADPAPTLVEGLAYLFSNDTRQTVDFPLPSGVTWEHLDGSAAGSSVSIEPFRSAVLLAADGDTSTLPPYQLFTQLGTSTYAEWAEGYSLAGDDALPKEDPDSDGIVNIWECYHGLNPTIADGPVLMEVTYDGSKGMVTTTRVLDRPSDIALTVWTSGGLDEWFEVEYTVETSARSGAAGHERVEITFDTFSFTPTFAQIELSVQE